MMNLEIEDAPDGLILDAATREPVVKVFNGATIEETEARLNLFAAAPEMLEALKFYVEYTECMGAGIDLGLEVLAKAEGR